LLNAFRRILCLRFLANSTPEGRRERCGGGFGDGSVLKTVAACSACALFACAFFCDGSDRCHNSWRLKPGELDALLAPIALYPDALLAEMLMASTYPIEVVHAERWATENKNPKNDQLRAAVDKQAWDEGVKALVATPSVLTMMSMKLDWTQKLGDAVRAQQADVMDAIQRL
jgi:hypothetical protein